MPTIIFMYTICVTVIEKQKLMIGTDNKLIMTEKKKFQKKSDKMNNCFWRHTWTSLDEFLIYLCLIMGIGCQIWLIPKRIPRLKSGLA